MKSINIQNNIEEAKKAYSEEFCVDFRDVEAINHVIFTIEELIEAVEEKIAVYKDDLFSLSDALETEWGFDNKNSINAIKIQRKIDCLNDELHNLKSKKRNIEILIKH